MDRILLFCPQKIVCILTAVNLSAGFFTSQAAISF